MTNKDIGRRITIAREKAGLNRKELADKIDVSPSTISRYENGTFSRLKLAILESIGNATGINPLWLSGRSESMNHPHMQSPHKDLLPIGKKRLSLFDGIACGEPRLIPDGIEVYVDVATNLKADYVLKAHGNSMTGARIRDGDLVFIRQQSTVENGEIAVVMIGDSATLKRVYWYAQNSLLVLRAENPEYDDQEFSGQELDNVKMLGKAIAFQSDLK